MINTIIFPSSFFDQRQIDEDMKLEYEAVLSTEKFRVIFFGYEDWFCGGQLTLSEEPENIISAVYRGWMMNPEQYSNFYHSLLAHHIRLITTPDMYEKMHIFPNIYPDIREDTAQIMTFPLYSHIDVAEVKKHFPRFMVKDYVKSVKGTEFPSCFDKSVTQDDFDKWMEIFYKYRADLLTGGICLKEYLNLKYYGNHTNEYRVFYLNHEIISVCRNSLQGIYTNEPPKFLIEKYQFLDSIFYSIDFAEMEDGSWKVIETGDGSVSGLSDGQNYSAFFRSIYQCLN